MSHNVVIFQGKDAKGPRRLRGRAGQRPNQDAYKVPALAAGRYFFHCEVHPTTMIGHHHRGVPRAAARRQRGPVITRRPGVAFDSATIDMAATRRPP